MAHAPFPFFKASRGTWYVQIGPTQHSLGRHPDDQPAPVKKAGKWQPPPAVLAAFYKLMAELPESDAAAAVTGVPATSTLALEVFEEFLAWCQKHKAPLTYVWYRDRIEAFARTIDRHLRVEDLKPIAVERWVDAHPDWSASHQRNCKVAVQRAFAWAEKMGVIDKNPIRHLPKPQGGRRERVISSAEYEALLARFTDSFRDLLELCWHTGCRPQEAVRIEARLFDEKNRRVVLPPKEAKGKKRYRIIYLNDPALSLVKRLCEERPEGVVFRNADDQPWKAAAVNNRFCRLQQSAGKETAVEPTEEGIAALVATLKPTKTVGGKEVAKDPKELCREARKKLRAKARTKDGAKVFLGAFRHTFATRLLEANVDSLTVSTLLGHVDGTMLSRVYQHLQQNSDHLLGALNRTATGGGASA